MTQEEFNSINWHRGNVVKLNNGKEYRCMGTTSHGKYLLLHSTEYDKCFVADYQIVECRTSDYEEPEEVYLQMKAEKRALAEAAREAERQERLRKKEELKQQHLREQEEAHARKVARKLAHLQKIEEAKAKKEAKVVQPKPSNAVEEKPSVPVAEAPKKRVRQRIRITKKVEY